ncbi:hypothetical protein [Mycobacterium marinum]|nr:hypothetical protein [Mycobacterium marinum]MDC9004900.1 hypothetical protein [Mycobacterium marinum]
MTTVIVVTLILLGLGIVTNELLRLRRWLKNAPPEADGVQPPDRDD